MAPELAIAYKPVTADDVVAYLQHKHPKPELPTTQQEPQSESNPYYAWGKLGRLMVDFHVKQVRDSREPNAGFTFLDVCSATPWLREVERGQYRQECLQKTAAIVREIDADLRKESPLKHFARHQTNEILHRLLKKGNLPYHALEAAIFDVIFEPYETGVDTNYAESLQDYFMRRFRKDPSRLYYHLIENEQPDAPPVKKGQIPKGAWQSLVPAEAPISIVDTLRRCGLSRPEEYAEALAYRLSRQLVGTIRHVRFLSLDIADVQTFEKYADVNFDERVRKTQFFQNVLDPVRHIVGDATNLEAFDDQSVDVMSIIESFPFHKQFFPFGHGLAIVGEAARVLKPGGKFIDFAWTTPSASRNDREKLVSLEDQMEAMGFRVQISLEEKEPLIATMSSRERQLLERSPLFKGTGHVLPVLVATKLAA